MVRWRVSIWPSRSSQPRLPPICEAEPLVGVRGETPIFPIALRTESATLANLGNVG
jgi:hypothetical protein